MFSCTSLGGRSNNRARQLRWVVNQPDCTLNKTVLSVPSKLQDSMAFFCWSTQKRRPTRPTLKSIDSAVGLWSSLAISFIRFAPDVVSAKILGKTYVESMKYNCLLSHTHHRVASCVDADYPIRSVFDVVRLSNVNVVPLLVQIPDNSHKYCNPQPDV